MNRPHQPDLVALSDQVLAEMPVRAKIVAEYWRCLRAEGVEVYEALELTRDLANLVILGDDGDDLPGQEDEPA